MLFSDVGQLMSKHAGKLIFGLEPVHQSGKEKCRAAW